MVNSFKPGDVVVTDFGSFQHWSIVTDRKCKQSKPMLISATKRNGTVKEEPWDVVTQGKNTYVADVTYTKPLLNILKDARSQIDIWKYSIFNDNCEHFVNSVIGLNISSTQIKALFVGGTAGAFLVNQIAKEPTKMKQACGAAILGAMAVSAVRAKEKPTFKSY